MSAKVVTVSDIVVGLPRPYDYTVIGHLAEVYTCVDRVSFKAHVCRVVTDETGVTRVYLAPTIHDLPTGLI